MNSYERSNETRASRGGPDTREALLHAARQMFARRGYDGASIRAITREAGANLGSVTYHFGSKERLYEEVLQSVLSPLATKVADAAAAPGDSVDRTVGVVRVFFGHLDENPDLPHLMLQELAAGKRPPPPVESFLRGVIGHFSRVVVEGQERGEIRPGDPVLLGLSCIIQPIHLTLVRAWLEVMRGMDSTDPDRRKELVEHAVRFARAGLRAHQEESS